MKLYAGTSGYSYKEWKGYFYPEKMKPEEMLSFYATKLPAVEINNTFYRLPKRAAGVPLRHQGFAEDHAHETLEGRRG
jgi:uncharacterized protein YecE (DUF72 family)